MKIKTTPWGNPTWTEEILEGIFVVSTSSHGGICISKEVAKDKLSIPARECAILHEDFYCFEEDCDWAIPFYEIEELQATLELDEKTTAKEYLENSLNYWNKSYMSKIINEKL